jgi:cytochrome P450
MMSARVHETLIYAVSHPLPFAFAEVVRRFGDAVDVPGIGLVINEPQLARSILLDTEHFNKNGPGSMGVPITQVMGPTALLNMEGDSHRRLRGLLADLFAPAYLDVIERDVIAEPVAALRSDLEAGHTVDLVRFIQLLTGRLTFHLLGMETASEHAEDTYLDLFRLSRALTSRVGLNTRRLSERQVADSSVHFERLTAPVLACYERSDLPQTSVIARVRELGLSVDEARGVVGMLLIVGTETLTTSVPRMLAVLVDSGQLGRLRQERSAVGAVVEEAFRYMAPTPFMVRSTAAEVTIAGRRLKRGQRVLIFTYNSLKHRDPYPDPFRFDPARRQPNGLRHLAFGAGPHFCLGFGVANRVMRLVLETILDTEGKLRIVRRRYGRSLVPGYSRLDVQVVR